jgi:hypothetical protein
MAPLRKLPETDHDILISMWTTLVGTNGEGLLGKFEKFSEKTDFRLSAVEQKLPSMWTRQDHDKSKAAEIEDAGIAKKRRKVSTREWILIAMTFIGPIAAVLIK